mmetsp:Transcript_4069/g.14943  ORF Transcript_4069/g.14943 Transcript_4069/m.14943 type:complete len:270 (+) Transcript_4069:2266-3075(+)
MTKRALFFLRTVCLSPRPPRRRIHQTPRAPRFRRRPSQTARAPRTRVPGAPPPWLARRPPPRTLVQQRTPVMQARPRQCHRIRPSCRRARATKHHLHLRSLRRHSSTQRRRATNATGAAVAPSLPRPDCAARVRGFLARSQRRRHVPDARGETCHVGDPPRKTPKRALVTFPTSPTLCLRRTRRPRPTARIRASARTLNCGGLIAHQPRLRRGFSARLWRPRGPPPVSPSPLRFPRRSPGPGPGRRTLCHLRTFLSPPALCSAPRRWYQ